MDTADLYAEQVLLLIHQHLHSLYKILLLLQDTMYTYVAIAVAIPVNILFVVLSEHHAKRHYQYHSSKTSIVTALATIVIYVLNVGLPEAIPAIILMYRQAINIPVQQLCICTHKKVVQILPDHGHI